MQINNPFQMNDWGIKKFLKVVIAIQFAMWGVIGLDFMGLQIPILRQFIGFVYLTFVPGIIILRILKLHKLGNIETLLYTVGLSIATLMFTGLIMNTIYPFFGISGPISLTSLLITISVLVLVLCVLSYVRDKDFSEPSFIDVKDILSPPVLFLCLIPFLAVFGTYLVNFHHNNILLLFLIIIIAIIVISIAFDKFIPKKLYPLAVFVIATSLLYHSSLISLYLTGYDVHTEYYVSNLVMTTAYWDSTVPHIYNVMLSIVMLAPIFSNICSMNLTWVFKIIYPLLFSLVPLGLYQVFQKQTGDKIAFLACFFFTAFFTFYHLSSRKQWIAEFFLVLLILLMIDKNMNKIKKSFLFIVFGLSLAVSHYGTSYIYMFSLIFAWLILIFMDRLAAQKLGDNFHSKFSGKREKTAGNPFSLKIGDRTISSIFVLLFVVFTLTWYIYTSGSFAFNKIVRIGDRIACDFVIDFLNPETAEGLALIITETVSPLQEVAKYLHLLALFFILLGVITLMLKRDGMKFEREFVAFSLMNFLLCIAGIVAATRAFSTERLYHLTLFFLAPLCVIGGITVFKMVSGVVRVSWTDHCVSSSLRVLSVFFAILLLFNSGFVYEVAKNQPDSISLSQEWIKEYGDTQKKAMFYTAFTPEQEVFSAKWLSNKMENEEKVYATYNDMRVHALTSYGMIPIKDVLRLTNTTKEIQKDAYVYLQYLNVIEGIGTQRKSAALHWRRENYYNMTEIYPLYKGKSEIYSNGASEIYR